MEQLTYGIGAAILTILKMVLQTIPVFLIMITVTYISDDKAIFTKLFKKLTNI